MSEAESTPLSAVTDHVVACQSAQLITGNALTLGVTVVVIAAFKTRHTHTHTHTHACIDCTVETTDCFIDGCAGNHNKRVKASHTCYRAL